MLKFELKTERQDIPALVEECPEVSLVRCAVGLKEGKIEFPGLWGRAEVGLNSLWEILQ